MSIWWFWLLSSSSQLACCMSINDNKNITAYCSFFCSLNERAFLTHERSWIHIAIIILIWNHNLIYSYVVSLYLLTDLSTIIIIMMSTKRLNCAIKSNWNWSNIHGNFDILSTHLARLCLVAMWLFAHLMANAEYIHIWMNNVYTLNTSKYTKYQYCSSIFACHDRKRIQYFTLWADKRSSN